MTGTSSPEPAVTEGPLSAELAAAVLDLCAAAARADGVTPLSEDTLLQVRHGSGARARDLVLTAGDGTLAGYAHLDPPDADGEPSDSQDGDGQAGEGQDADDQHGGASGELVIHPDWRRRGLGTALVRAVLDGRGADGTGSAGASGHGALRLWAHGELPGAAALARTAGFTRFRALLKLRMPLAAAPPDVPAAPPGVTLRTFRPGEDEEAWLAVNRSAFAHHPEQGGWSMTDLRLREAEPWFDPAGFFLAERDGQLAGFHWTKVHPDGGTGGAPIGEVYVVGVDPGQQGGGLGRVLTQAGLAHLRVRGLADVMLYVDESNTAAVRMYESLGFTRWSVDAMYRRP